MKKLLVALLLSLPAVLSAAPLNTETPCMTVGTAFSISASTSSWTKVPAAQMAGRSGIFLRNPSTTEVVAAIMSGNSSSPVEATSVRPFAFPANHGFGFLPASDKLYVYVLSLGAAAITVGGQECKQ